MDEFSAEVMAFMRECTGKEPQWRCVSGAGVCVDAEERLAAVIVPLDFFSSGGTAERLISAGAAISGWTAADRMFLYEDRWRNSGPAVRAMMRVRMGQGLRVFARNCEVRPIAPETAAAFLQRNHVYGSARARYRLGLFRVRSTGNAEAGMDRTPGMVAVATFSSGQRREDGTLSYEWVRYASAQGVRVVGGMGRLLDAFVTTVGDGTPVDVMTYADLEWYDGRSYRRLGFKPCGDRAPVWFLCRPGCPGRQICRSGAALDEDDGVRICNLGSRKYVLRKRQCLNARGACRQEKQSC